LSRCICGTIPHAINCPANPRRRLREVPGTTRIHLRGESPAAIATIGPADLEPAWKPEEQARWKFEQES
jgi:hypothetical protein